MSLYSQRKALINSLIGVLLFVIVGIFSDITNTPDTRGIDTSNIQAGTYIVSEVVDGDTIKVQSSEGETTIRLIGIDTPEVKDPRSPIECFGQESSNYLKTLIQNKVVILIPDDTQEDVDRYGRLLRYVLLDGVNINKKMIFDGYAYEYTYSDPYKYQEEFQEAEAFSINNKLGLWSSDTCNGER